MMEKGQDEEFLITKMPRYFIVTVDKIIVFLICFVCVCVCLLSIFPFFNIKVRVRVNVRFRARVRVMVKLRVRFRVKRRLESGRRSESIIYSSSFFIPTVLLKKMSVMGNVPDNIFKSASFPNSHIYRPVYTIKVCHQK
jgi:hypothetical protein